MEQENNKLTLKFYSTETNTTTEITKDFPNWCEDNTLQTLIWELKFCLMGIGYGEELIEKFIKVE